MTHMSEVLLLIFFYVKPSQLFANELQGIPVLGNSWASDFGLEHLKRLLADDAHADHFCWEEA